MAEQRWTIYVCPECADFDAAPFSCEFLGGPAEEVEVVPAEDADRLAEALEYAQNGLRIALGCLNERGRSEHHRLDKARRGIKKTLAGADNEEHTSLLVDALRATEWHREDGHGPPQCTVCGGWGDMPEGLNAGHRADCIVGQALGREPNRGDPDLIAEKKDAETSLPQNFAFRPDSLSSRPQPRVPGTYTSAEMQADLEWQARRSLSSPADSQEQDG